MPIWLRGKDVVAALGSQFADTLELLRRVDDPLLTYTPGNGRGNTLWDT